MLVSILTSAGGVAYHILLNAPEYEAKTSLYIMAKKDGEQLYYFDDIMVSKQMLKDYKEIIESDKVAERTIEKLNLMGYNSQVFDKKISVTLKNDTNIIEISVMDSDPVKARDIANTLSQVFIDTVHQFTTVNLSGIEILDMAKIPESPDGPVASTIVLLSFAAGLMGIVAIIVLMGNFDDRLRTVEDIESCSGLNVIGILPEMDIK